MGVEFYKTHLPILIFIVSKKKNYVFTFELGWYASSDAVIIVAGIFFFFFIKTQYYIVYCLCNFVFSHNISILLYKMC